MTILDEQYLNDYAQYYLGMFVGALHQHTSDHNLIAHALFVLIEAAKARREEFIKDAT